VTAQPVPSLLRLRQHKRAGLRSPHKPLLVLLALGRYAQAGSSDLRWSQAQTDLGRLLEDFGPPSKTGASQAAAYPFTRLRADGL
jgi:putative restriction endonuclease